MLVSISMPTFNVLIYLIGYNWYIILYQYSQIQIFIFSIKDKHVGQGQFLKSSHLIYFLSPYTSNINLIFHYSYTIGTISRDSKLHIPRSRSNLKVKNLHLDPLNMLNLYAKFQDWTLCSNSKTYIDTTAKITCWHRQMDRQTLPFKKSARFCLELRKNACLQMVMQRYGH